MFASAPSAVPQIKSGKVRALATTGAARSPFLPDVPTIAESGFPGYEATNWYAYMAPGRTPREIIARLNRELVKALHDPAVKDLLNKQGLEPAPGTPEQLARFTKSEYDTWGRVVKEAGIKIE
jgi:tripartite-type tricarboxylate transporter receptor subunit TctC